MQRLLVTARLDFETLPPDGDFLALAELLNHAGPEKDQIIAECGDEGEPIRIRLSHKGEEQKRRINPGNPFNFERQNKENVDDFVRIKMGEGEEEIREQHLIRKLAVGQNRGHRRADHSHQKIKREPEWSPGAFEAVADEPEKPERDEDEKRMRHLGNENVSDQAPDFTGADPGHIQGEVGIEALVQINKDENQDVEGNDGADQSWNGDEAEAAFEFVEKAHRCEHGRGSAACFNWRDI